MRSASRAALPLLALALTASACSALDDDPATDGELTIAAAFYPLQFVSERVAGEHAEVTNLTSPGQEPHDLELTVRQAGEISDADLVVYESLFQPAVDDAVEQNASGAVLDAAEHVDLLAVGESEEEHDEHTGEDEHADEEHADEEHAEDEHADEDEHDHGDNDPHFWLDPLRVADLADAVAAELSDLDPDNAADYEANAKDLRTDLEELDAAYATGLEGCERDTIVVSHDAFGYLEKYGIHIAPIAGIAPDSEPTPADIAELQELIREEGITTVFAETLWSPEAAEALAGDLGIETSVLDPIEGLTEDTAEEDYVSIMESNLDAIATANGCS